MANMIQLSKGNFNDTLNKHSVLVDFWADWCGPCKILAPILDELAEKYEDTVVFAKVNVDEEPELAAQFSIKSIPTVILFKNGQPSASLVGVQPLSAYEAILSSL